VCFKSSLGLKSLTANNIFNINDLNIYLGEFLIFFLDFLFGGMFIRLIAEIIGDRHRILLMILFQRLHLQ
jgi:hypothetical protein